MIVAIHVYDFIKNAKFTDNNPMQTFVDLLHLQKLRDVCKYYQPDRVKYILYVGIVMRFREHATKMFNRLLFYPISRSHALFF